MQVIWWLLGIGGLLGIATAGTLLVRAFRADYWIPLRLEIPEYQWRNVTPALRQHMRHLGPGPFFKLYKLAGRSTHILTDGLPPIAQLIDRFGIEALLRLAREAQASSNGVFHGLSLVLERIQSETDLADWGKVFIAAVAAGEPRPISLSDLKHLIASLPEPEALPALLNQISMRDPDRRFCRWLPLLGQTVRTIDDFIEHQEIYSRIVKPNEQLDVELYYGRILNDLSWAAGNINSGDAFREFLESLVRLCSIEQRADTRSWPYQALVREQGDTPERTSQPYAIIRFPFVTLTTLLPRNATLLLRVGLKPVVDIAVAAGVQARAVLEKGLPAVRSLIDRFGIDAFVTFARNEKEGTAVLFDEALPAASTVVDRFGIEPFLAISNETPGIISGLCFAFANCSSEIETSAQLTELAFWRSSLYATRTSLVRPWFTRAYDTDPYGQGTYEVRHDPDSAKRGALDAALREVRRRVHANRTAVPPSFPVEHRIPEQVTQFLRLMSEEGLSDIVLVGGTPRGILLGEDPPGDILLGEDAYDFDVTFVVQLLEEDKALEGDAYLWNSVLSGALQPRLAEFERVRERLRRSFMRVDYVGPYENFRDENRTYTWSRCSAVFAADAGRLYNLDPMISINSLGIMTDGRWIGDRQGLTDALDRRLAALKPITTVDPGMMLRLVLQKLRFDLSFSAEIESALRSLGDSMRRSPKEFASWAHSERVFKPLETLLNDHLLKGTIRELDSLGVRDVVFRWLSKDRIKAVENRLASLRDPMRERRLYWRRVSISAICTTVILAVTVGSLSSYEAVGALFRQAPITVWVAGLAAAIGLAGGVLFLKRPPITTLAVSEFHRYRRYYYWPEDLRL